MIIDHIGIATININYVAKEYELLGFRRMGEVIDDNLRNIRILFMENEGIYRIELIEILDKTKTSPISSLIEKNSHIIYHTCYRTNNIEQTINELRKQGYVLVTKPEAAIAFNNSKVSFLYNRSIGLIELVES